MFSLDLASGYHQVDMDPRYYTYLGFQWEGEFYVFSILPFGLASAPWCFTKNMRAISLYLRFRGVRLPYYQGEHNNSEKSEKREKTYD